MKIHTYFVVGLLVVMQRKCLCEGYTKKQAEDSFTEHQVVLPRIYNKQDKQIFTTLTQNGHLDEITVHIPLRDQQIVLDLHKNKQLFPGTYIEKYFTPEGARIVSHHSNKTTLHCYYHGHARDHDESVAAVSTCDGVRATVYLAGDTLHVEPTSSVIHGEHLVFRDMHQIPVNYTCGVNSVGHVRKLDYAAPHQRLKREIRWPAESNKNTKIVELYVVNDYRQYAAYGYDVSRVIKRTKEVINAASALYKPINIHIALVAVEIWNNTDQIQISEDAETTMKNFLEYRRTDISPQHKNDNAQLLTDHTFGEGVIGKAPINTMCSWQYSGGVNMDHHVLVGPVATTVAHEMGHNFGLAHDGAECTCPESRCIMNRNSGGNQPKHWSSCSRETFEDAFHQGMDYCLHDLPGELFQGPVCGNGFLEDGEECDCGTPDSCDSKCCDAATCTLLRNATCATGACCDLDTCQLKAKSTLCRRASDVCDLDEYCHGNSEFCPADAYVKDGTECKVSGQQAYCYKGRCRNHESQCQLLWGRTGHNSADICYTNYNVQGIPNGHCGFHWIDKSFDACAQEDVMCGMLHCRHLNEKLMFWQEPLSYTMPKSVIPDERGNLQACYGAILDVGLDYQDPGMVPDGAKCAPNKICVDAKCISLGSLEMKSCPDCHNNGVCNHLGQCHCDVGYAPPLCDRPGNGGSEHSGPIKILESNRALVIGMIVLFVVILPLLAAFVYIAYRHREQIKKIWEARTRRDKYRSIFRAKPGSANDAPTTKAVPRPPQRPKVAVAREPVTSCDRPPTTGVKRASSFSPSDIGAFKFESTTNKQLEKMDEIPVRYRSPTLEQARSNRPLSYPSSYPEDGEIHHRQDEFKPQPTRPAPAPPGAPNVGAHGGMNTQTKPKGYKPERPPQPDLSKVGHSYHANEAAATVASRVPKPVRQTEPVSAEDSGKYYQNVPKYTNGRVATGPASTQPHQPSTVSSMVNKFEQPLSNTEHKREPLSRTKSKQPEVTFEHTSSILGSAENKRPVPRPRSMAPTGQLGADGKKPDLPRKPPLPAPLSRNASKPAVTPKPFTLTGENRSNGSIC